MVGFEISLDEFLDDDPRFHPFDRQHQIDGQRRIAEGKSGTRCFGGQHRLGGVQLREPGATHDFRAKFRRQIDEIDPLLAPHVERLDDGQHQTLLIHLGQKLFEFDDDVLVSFHRLKELHGDFLCLTFRLHFPATDVGIENVDDFLIHRNFDLQLRQFGASDFVGQTTGRAQDPFLNANILASLHIDQCRETAGAFRLDGPFDSHGRGRTDKGQQGGLAGGGGSLTGRASAGFRVRFSLWFGRRSLGGGDERRHGHLRAGLGNSDLPAIDRRLGRFDRHTVLAGILNKGLGVFERQFEPVWGCAWSGGSRCGHGWYGSHASRDIGRGNDRRDRRRTGGGSRRFASWVSHQQVVAVAVKDHVSRHIAKLGRQDRRVTESQGNSVPALGQQFDLELRGDFHHVSFDRRIAVDFRNEEAGRGFFFRGEKLARLSRFPKRLKLLVR